MKNIKKIRVSGSDIFVFKKKTILMSLCLIFVLLEFGSCSQLFNTPSSGNNSSGTTGYTGCIFKISVTTPDGCVSSDILGTTGTKSAVSRSVFPVIPTNYKAKIWTTGSTVPDTWISPESGTNLTFNFGSVAAAAYTVRLGFFTDSSDAAPSFYADGTVTVTKGQTSADCTVSILPDNCTAGDGTTTTGSISLELTDEATEIKSFSASLVNSSSTTLLTVTQKTGASDSSTYAIIGTGFPEGTYTLKIYGLDSSGNIIYRYPSDVLYVWPGLTTNTWYLNDDTKPASLDITEDMYKTALATTIYVSENGSDTGDGGYYKPFKTVQHAVNCCTDTAINGTDGTGYTIYIDGKITLSSNSDDTDTIMIDNSKKITFAGLKGASTDIIDGGKAYQILTVSSGSTVTIVDLMLQNGYTSGNGGCISNAGTLTINGSTLTGCTAVNGGGVYNSGTLTMTGGTITGNTASSGGSGVYNSGTFNISGSAVVDANSNDVYLADGCVITVTGNLSETTVAEITMQYPVPGAEVLAFSGVSGSENICGQFTYENDNTDGTTDPDGSTTINENDGRNYALHYGSSSGILTCDRFYVEGNNSTELTESGTGTQTQSDTTGSPDYADGSKQKPFAGVQKAASLISTFPSAADPTGGYTIYIDGTVSLSSTINISTKKKLTLEGMSGSGTDILNGGHTSGGTDGCQILNIALGSTVTMENLTLKNGYSSGNGGCVYNAGTLTISSSNIKNCTAKYSGGGVYNKGTFNMYNSTIKSCSANPGGGVYNYSGKFNMYSGTIGGTTDADGNKASSYGGGVFNYLGGTFNFSGGTISHNTADGNAGGIDNNGGTVNITGITCTISGNISKGTGGGINNYSEKTTDYPGKIIMSAGTISGNTAATSGGGVNMESGKFNMSGGTIGGTDADDINKASDGSGGGVNIQAGEDVGTDKTATLTMSGGTIIGNTATYGGGVNICSGGTFKMSGSAVVASNNDVYLTTGKYITIAGTLSPVSNTTDSSSLSAVITTPETASSYTTGTQVLTLLTSGSWDECNYFGLSRPKGTGIESGTDTVSKKSIIKPSGTSGVIALAGAGVTPTYSPTLYTLTTDKVAFIQGLSSNTVTLSVTNSIEASVTPTSAALTLYQSGESTGITQSATGSLPTLTLPSYLPAETYQLFMSAVIGGNAYSGWEDIVIFTPASTTADVTTATTFSDIQTKLASTTAGDHYIYLANDMTLTSALSASYTSGCNFYILPAPGKTITLTRDSSFTDDALISTSACEMNIGDPDGTGTIILDGGAGNDLSTPAVTATAPLVSLNYGCACMYHVTMQNNYNNASEGTGGAIYDGQYRYISLYDCTITNCYAASGGGMYVYCLANLYNTSITNCSAINGGGMYFTSPGETYTSHIYSGSSITGNSATTNGGGIYYAGDTLYIDYDVDIKTNTASSGSQLYVSSGSVYRYTDTADTSTTQISGTNDTDIISGQ